MATWLLIISLYFYFILLTMHLLISFWIEAGSISISHINTELTLNWGGLHFHFTQKYRVNRVSGSREKAGDQRPTYLTCFKLEHQGSASQMAMTSEKFKEVLDYRKQKRATLEPNHQAHCLMSFSWTSMTVAGYSSSPRFSSSSSAGRSLGGPASTWCCDAKMRQAVEMHLFWKCIL